MIITEPAGMPIFAILALAATQAVPPAPERPEEGSVRAVTVTAVDDKGRPVEGLAAEEIAVVENGAARTVTRFERDRRNLTVAILVDSSEPQSTSFRLYFVDAVLQLVQRLPEGTKYSIWTTGDRPRKVADYGDEPAAVSKALRRAMTSGGNTLLDAIVEARKDLVDQESSRSAMVILTGTGIGFTNSHRQQVADEMAKGSTAVFVAQVDDNRVPFTTGEPAQGEVSAADYDYVLSRVSDQTGGRREVLLAPMGVADVLKAFAAEMKAQYRLSYVSGDKGKVEIKVARPGVKVRMGSTRP